MIEVGFDAVKIDKYFEASEKAVDLAVKTGMNKALEKTRKIAAREFEERRGVTESSKIKFSDLIDTKKVTLSNVRNVMNARMDAEFGTRTGLIHYVLGSKRPQKISGVAMRLRRQIHIKFSGIYPHENSCIQTPRLGKYRKGVVRGEPQVFSYGMFKGTKRLFRQTVDDAHSFVTREKTQKEMEREAFEEAELKFYEHMERQLEKMNREPLTMGEQRGRGYK